MPDEELIPTDGDEGPLLFHEQTVIHEVGHCVMAYIAGFTLCGLSLSAGEPTKTADYARMGEVLYEVPVRMQVRAELNAAYRRMLQKREYMVLVSGRIVESARTGLPSLGADGDIKAETNLILWAILPEFETDKNGQMHGDYGRLREAFKQPAWNRAARICATTRFQRAVDAVIAALPPHGRLSGEELTRVIAAAMVKPCPPRPS